MSESLSELQRRMVGALRHGSALERAPEWALFAEQHMTGNARLSPVEQLEIYREQFWLRHTSSLVEDFPGLSGILGQADWERLAEQYLAEVTPDSYTLRDLGQRLPELIGRADWLPHRALCLDMARLELAYIAAFDAADSGYLPPERLAAVPEEQLGTSLLVLAPSLQLLQVGYPVAELRRRLRASQQQVSASADDPIAIPEPRPQCLVVYRRDLKLWDMPVSAVAFAFLSGLAQGAQLATAAERAAPSPDAEAELGEHIGVWLQEWTSKGLITGVRT
jgi:hypothetical protein